MNPLYPIISLSAISLISLVGGLIIFLKNKAFKKNLQIYLISFSAGTLLSVSFIHLFPEATEKIPNHSLIGILVITGILLSFILEKIICWRHCHLPIDKNHTHKFAYINIFGDLLHNFIDGISIIAAYQTNPLTGLSTTLAVASHEIPQEIADFGILLYSGFSYKKALLYNFLTSLSAFAGAGVGLVFSSLLHVEYLLPIVIGNFIYIATADLIPELHKEQSFKTSTLQLFFFLTGAIIIYLI